MKSARRQRKKPVLFQILLLFIMASPLLFSGCEAKKNKIYQVGVLIGFQPHKPIFEGFKEEMAELGYLEGKNIVYDIHLIETDKAGQKKTLDRFVEKPVDLIYVFPTGVTLLAKGAVQGTNVPVISGYSVFKEKSLVESIAQPGGNLTGVRFTGAALTAKRFEMLYEVAPNKKRIFITYDKNYAASLSSLASIREAASFLNATLVEVPITSPHELKKEFQTRETLDDIGFDAIQMLTDLTTQSAEGWTLIREFAKKHGIPIGGSSPATVTESVVYLGFDFYDLGRLSAPLAHKIFKGDNPGTIPVVTPEYHLTINMRRAREIGLNIPEGMVGMAQTIIQ